MSYILDALKRAEAERGRGSVPGLHTRQATSPAAGAAANLRSRVWLGIGALLTLGLVAAGVWVWQTAKGDPRPLAMPSPVAPTPSQISAPITTVPVASVPAIELAAKTASAPVRVTATAPVAAAVPAPVTKSVPAVTTRAASVVAKQARPKTPLEPVFKEVPPAVATPTAVPLLSELSENIRRQIPALAITGAVYSNNPGQRLLLVNNQVLSQGSQAAPELKLEEIGEHSSVFDFRGTRFRLAH